MMSTYNASLRSTFITKINMHLSHTLAINVEHTKAGYTFHI